MGANLKNTACQLVVRKGRQTCRMEIHWNDAAMRRVLGDAHGSLRAEVERKVRGIRCKTHGESPRVELQPTVQGADIVILGCCEELKERAAKEARL